MSVHSSDPCAKRNILKVKPCDIDKLIAKLCLEQTQVINYCATKTEKGDGGDDNDDDDNNKRGGGGGTISNIAGFFFADFQYIDHTSKYKVANLLAVEINLETKTFVKAMMDDDHLTTSETLILLWFNTIAVQHVKLRSLANWGVNCDESLKDTNPFFYRNSMIYSNLQFLWSLFQHYMGHWEDQGLLAAGFDSNTFMDCFYHGARANICLHTQIDDLIKHSRFVNFQLCGETSRRIHARVCRAQKRFVSGSIRRSYVRKHGPSLARSYFNGLELGRPSLA